MKLTIRDRVSILLLAAIGMSGVVGIVGWLALDHVRIGGAVDENIRRYVALQVDAAPPPLFLVEAGMHLHQVAVTADPERRRADWQEFQKHRHQFDSALTHHDSALAGSPVLPYLHASVDPMRDFLRELDGKFAPLVAAGDREGMMEFLDRVYAPAHERHDSLNEVLMGHLDSVIAVDRADAQRSVRLRVGSALAVFLLFTALMVFLLFHVRGLLSDSVVFERLARNAAVNILLADLDGKIVYANELSMRTLRSIAHLLPCRPEEIVGRSIDIFHSDPGRIRAILSDPANLPHVATIPLGDEWMTLTIVAVRDEKDRYIGPMLCWDLATTRVKSGRHVEAVAAHAERLQGTAAELAAGADSVLASSRSTEAASRESAASVSEADRELSMMAAGAEEMSASVAEIARNVSEAARVAREAARTTAEVDTRIRDLGASSAEITKVVNVISDIADQTKLLALNATIEAARAGETGKGFAVVASEVKALAQQTGGATEDIGNMVGNIHRDVAASVEAMAKVSEVVARIESLQTAVAAAVEQQNATAREIAQGVGSSARAVRRISDAAKELSDASGMATVSAERGSRAASELAAVSRELGEATRELSETEARLAEERQRFLAG